MSLQLHIVWHGTTIFYLANILWNLKSGKAKLNMKLWICKNIVLLECPPLRCVCLLSMHHNVVSFVQVKEHEVSIFLMQAGMLGTLHALWEVFPLFTNTGWGENSNIAFLKKHMGASFEERPQPWVTNITADDAIWRFPCHIKNSQLLGWIWDFGEVGNWILCRP